VVAAQLVLLAYQVKSNQDMRLIRVWSVTAITPVAKLVDMVRGGTVGFIKDYFILLSAREENRRLKDELDRLKLQKQHIGFVFQSYHLLDNLTVAENIDLPLSYRDVKRGEREALVGDILDRFNIVGKKDLYPNQLSGGQQQLVAIARAVVASPSIILADEPTGNLHSDQGREIMELFAKLNAAGTTIVQVTHSEVNAGYGRRVIQLKDGWVVDGR
jgi:ABC-type lipoprotein export system ATPase subunit